MSHIFLIKKLNQSLFLCNQLIKLLTGLKENIRWLIIKTSLNILYNHPQSKCYLPTQVLKNTHLVRINISQLLYGKVW